PLTFRMNVSEGPPLRLSRAPPARLTSPTQMTFAPPAPTIVCGPLRRAKVCVHGCAAAAAAALRAALTCPLRSTPCVPPPTTVALPVRLTVAPGANEALPLTSAPPDSANAPFAPTHVFPAT